MTKSKFQNLRKKYPKFIYEKYFWKISGNNLEIFFDFSIYRENGSRSIKFRPKIIIELQKLDPVRNRRFLNGVDNLIFHLGLMEIPSYWKATCSREIEIQAGFLNKEQINWWEDLIIRGMGQFFYENKIDWRSKNFLNLTVNCLQKDATAHFYRQNLKNKYLVPFAGGRDSIITLEGLKGQKKEIALFTVNTIERIQKVVRISGIKKQIIVRRIIDKKLLGLNEKGYLNGHTPFTALLSFTSLLCAAIFDYKNIAFSNEKSANEGNVKYLGEIINHQWAKSSEFEKKFRNYCKKYLVKNVNYFSFTRKYGELEISKMLIKYPKYFPVFSSCNAGMRIKIAGEARWCGNCPKCLFIYMSLYPLLKKKKMLEIFGKDIFENRGLLPIMKGLLGQGKPKPFECVGTYQENRRIFKLCLQKAKKLGEIPFLLTR